MSRLGHRLAVLRRETAVVRSLDFVEIQNNEATAAVASIEDAAACDERADALVSGLLARVMRRRGTIATALDYVRSLARDTRANCWELAESAGHGLPYRMQGLACAENLICPGGRGYLVSVADERVAFPEVPLAAA